VALNLATDVAVLGGTPSVILISIHVFGCTCAPRPLAQCLPRWDLGFPGTPSTIPHRMDPSMIPDLSPLKLQPL